MAVPRKTSLKRGERSNGIQDQHKLSKPVLCPSTQHKETQSKNGGKTDSITRAQKRVSFLKGLAKERRYEKRYTMWNTVSLQTPNTSEGEKKRTRNNSTNQKKVNKIIPQSSPIKRHRLTDWIKNLDSTKCCLQKRHTLLVEPLKDWRLKNGKLSRQNWKQDGLAILVSENRLQIKLKEITKAITY